MAASVEQDHGDEGFGVVEAAGGGAEAADAALTEFSETVHPSDLSRGGPESDWFPLFTDVGVVADQLFLLAVNADHRLTRGQELAGLIGTGKSYVHTVSTDTLTLLVHHVSRVIEAIIEAGSSISIAG